MTDLDNARARWQTSSDDDERTYWSTFSSCQLIRGALQSWADDHPEWNPGLTPDQFDADALALWDWSHPTDE